MYSAPIVYVGTLDDQSVTLVWGDPEKTGNPIGWNGAGLGKVTVHINDQTLNSSQSWLRISGLKPDTTYPYSIRKNGSIFAQGSIHTWPKKSEKLTFFVIGDWGNGTAAQYRLAQKMESERQRLRAQGQEVRFVISTGDNIYGLWKSGKNDREWIPKFFTPYAALLKEIPFYAVLGNHDGNESERTVDLSVYLDNFFFPNHQPSRWYHFQYGEFVEFLALDSTTNQLTRPPTPAYTVDGEQTAWLTEELKKPALHWRFIVMHHPMFTAGPDHPPFLEKGNHWFRLFQSGEVSAVFAGHEHNFQFSEPSDQNGRMAWFVSGAGGQLRAGNVVPKMKESQITAWAPQRHFLIVEVSPEQIKATPVSVEPLKLIKSDEESMPIPITVHRRH